MLFIEFTDVDGGDLLVNPRQVVIAEPCEYTSEEVEERTEFDVELNAYHTMCRRKQQKNMGTKIFLLGGTEWRIVKESYETVKSRLREELNLTFERG